MVCIEFGEGSFPDTSPVLVERDDLRGLTCALVDDLPGLELADGDLELDFLGRGKASS